MQAGGRPHPQEHPFAPPSKDQLNALGEGKVEVIGDKIAVARSRPVEAEDGKPSLCELFDRAFAGLDKSHAPRHVAHLLAQRGDRG